MGRNAFWFFLHSGLPITAPDVLISFECEGINIMHVIQIMPDLHKLCEDPSPFLSMVHL
jgi:hypothetical protein